jgi:hypothetical protein
MEGGADFFGSTVFAGGPDLTYSAQPSLRGRRSSVVCRPLGFETLEDRSVPAIVNLSWTDPGDPPPTSEYFAVIDRNAGPDGYGAISVADPDTGISLTLSDNQTAGYRAWVRPTAGALETINGVQYLLVVDPHGGRDGYGAIRRVNLTTGSVQLVADNWMIGYRGLVRPEAIVIEPRPDGDYLLIVDPQGGRDGRGAVRRLNPRTGGLQLVTDNLRIGYPALATPTGAALETVDGVDYLLVVDSYGGRDGFGAIRRVNLTNGSMQLVADNWSIGYRALVRPNAGTVELIGGSRYLRVVDPDGGPNGEAVVRLVDLEAGDVGLTATGGELRSPRGIATRSDGSNLIVDADRFGPLDAVLNGDDLQIVALSAAANETGYFSDAAGDLYFKKGAEFQRVGIGLSQTILSRDRQAAWGLRFDGLLLKWQGGAPYVLQTRVESVSLNADGQSVFVRRTWRPAYAQNMDDGYSLVARDHLNAIRINPSMFDDYYRMYAGQIVRELGGSFAGLSDEGRMAAFAALVTYEMKPYGFSDVLVDTNQDATLQRLLAEPDLACGRLCFMAMLLYERGRTEMGLQPLDWNMVGFVVESATGNHAQLFVEADGIPLLLDPTFGLVARTELDDLLAGTPLATVNVKEPAYRVEADPYLRNQIYTRNIVPIRLALWNGGYPHPKDPVPSGWTPIMYLHGETAIGL